MLLVLWATLGLNCFKRPGFLPSLLPSQHGIPSDNTLNHIIHVLAANLLSARFTAGFKGLRENKSDGVAIYGEAPLRAHRGKHQPRHVAAAWATRPRLVSGRAASSRNRNKIMVIPMPIEGLHLAGALSTINAVGCPIRIAHKPSSTAAPAIPGLEGQAPEPCRRGRVTV